MFAFPLRVSLPVFVVHRQIIFILALNARIRFIFCEIVSLVLDYILFHRSFCFTERNTELHKGKAERIAFRASKERSTVRSEN